LTSYAGRTSFSVRSPLASSGSGPPPLRPSESTSVPRVGSLPCLTGGVVVALLGVGRVNAWGGPALWCGASMTVKKSRSGLCPARRNRTLDMKSKTTTVMATQTNNQSTTFFNDNGSGLGEFMPVPLASIDWGIGDALLTAMANAKQAKDLRE